MMHVFLTQLTMQIQYSSLDSGCVKGDTKPYIMLQFIAFLLLLWNYEDHFPSQISLVH